MPRTQDDIGIGTTLGETDEQLRKRIKDHREQKKKHTSAPAGTATVFKYTHSAQDKIKAKKKKEAELKRYMKAHPLKPLDPKKDILHPGAALATAEKLPTPDTPDTSDSEQESHGSQESQVVTLLRPRKVRKYSDNNKHPLVDESFGVRTVKRAYDGYGNTYDNNGNMVTKRLKLDSDVVLTRALNNYSNYSCMKQWDGYDKVNNIDIHELLQRLYKIQLKDADRNGIDYKDENMIKEAQYHQNLFEEILRGILSLKFDKTLSIMFASFKDNGLIVVAEYDTYDLIDDMHEQYHGAFDKTKYKGYINNSDTNSIYIGKLQPMKKMKPNFISKDFFVSDAAYALFSSLDEKESFKEVCSDIVKIYFAMISKVVVTSKKKTTVKDRVKTQKLRQLHTTAKLTDVYSFKKKTTNHKNYKKNVENNENYMHALFDLVSDIEMNRALYRDTFVNESLRCMKSPLMTVKNKNNKTRTINPTATRNFKNLARGITRTVKKFAKTLSKSNSTESLTKILPEELTRPKTVSGGKTRKRK